MQNAPQWRTESPGHFREYAPVLAAAAPAGDFEASLHLAVRLLWDHFEKDGFSWVGFYQKVEGTDEMVLVCREPKPACSPIGLHGMCGRGWKERRPIIIQDVRTLGPNYIACDPRDQSELVVPLIRRDGTCWGVLDIDSYDIGAFNERDAEKCTELLARLGLSHPGAMHRVPMRL